MLTFPRIKSAGRQFSLAVALAMGIAGPAFAGSVNETGGVAVKGYDPVAYFTERRPVPGNEALTASHDGITYRFATPANRDAFTAAPARYLPQYGGFGAYGTASGYKADIEPQAFTIVGDKLYLNYNDEVRATWATDIPGQITKADANWPTVMTETDVYR